MPVIVNFSSDASQAKESPDVALWKVTSYPEPSEPTTTFPENVELKSSLMVSAVAKAFSEEPVLPAFAVLKTISPPAPEPFP